MSGMSQSGTQQPSGKDPAQTQHAPSSHPAPPAGSAAGSTPGGCRVPAGSKPGRNGRNALNVLPRDVDSLLRGTTTLTAALVALPLGYIGLTQLAHGPHHTTGLLMTLAASRIAPRGARPWLTWATTTLHRHLARKDTP